MLLEIEYEDKDGKLAYQTLGSAGFDLRSHESFVLAPRETRLVNTNVRIKHSRVMHITQDGRCLIGDDTIEQRQRNRTVMVLVPEMQARPRSGLTKKGILANLGTIDSDYRGSIYASLTNNSDTYYDVKMGDRITQAICCLTFRAENIDVIDKVRGEDGFGSSGVR